MPNVVVKENHLTFGGVAYFRGHAEEIELGSYGEIRKPFKSADYLEVQDKIVLDETKIKSPVITEIDFEKTSKTDLKLGVTALIEGVPVKLDGSASFQKMRSGELKLVKFSIDNKDMRDIVNKLPETLDFMKNLGKDARIAHQVFIVMEAKLANSFVRGVDVKLSAGVDGIEADLGVAWSADGKTKVVLSKNSCFAYLVAKIQWNKDKTSINLLRNDQWGVS